MYKIILSFFFLVIVLMSYSQKSYPFFMDIKGERKIVSDTAYVKVAPSFGAAVEDTLYLGAIIEIDMPVPFTEIRNGLTSPWYKVVYQKGLYKKIGFVSAIDMCLHSKQRSKNFEVLCGVIENNKKDTNIANEIHVLNNYKCKIVVLQNNKEIDRLVFSVEDKKANDSFSININEKLKLNKALMHVEFNQFNLKDTTKEFYTSNFILCKSKSIIELPTTHNYTKQPEIPFPTSSLIFKKSIIIHQTEYNKMMPQKIKDEYEWKDCNLKFKESK